MVNDVTATYVAVPERVAPYCSRIDRGATSNAPRRWRGEESDEKGTRARVSVHLDVRQFDAIDVYHYHEEHCLAPQLNVSGLSKRESVGPVIAQEIPDENAP
ncbi:hypothetical protein ALC60_00873 [Trachymyrmex zeteki]|uniref:Uncharacterized protein n=1 Tax=Mycetomoellerius zeteki TaxID=64791 RepID=A0A151XIL6_9HYME|nr:hypothetical protein ALC60_00873 [Trachymyrmex zeteki]